MSILLRIISVLLITGLLIESYSISMFAQDDGGIVVHSIDELISTDAVPYSTSVDMEQDFAQVLQEHEIYTHTGILDSGIAPTAARALTKDALDYLSINTDFDTWMGTQSFLIRMGIVKRRIARSLGLPGDKSITVNILEGTEIRTRESKTRTLKTVDMDTLSVEEANVEKQQKTFHFGIDGKHLIFSKPVEVQMKLIWAQDGQTRDIRVKHAGDIGFNTSGLSIDPNTSCNPDGTATIPGSSPIVQDGKVTFYTCGASAFLIDDIGLVPTAAFGLRRLSSSYTGSVIRVRRSSDNIEQDIGFSGNDLNTGALLTFVGSGNGFVSIWYDQSGNGRHATQATWANQPRIVNAGTLDTQGGKSIIRYTAEGQTLVTSARVFSNTEENAMQIGFWSSDGNKTPFSGNGTDQSQRFTFHSDVVFDYGTSWASTNRLSYVSTPTNYKIMSLYHSRSRNTIFLTENGVTKDTRTARALETWSQGTLQIGGTNYPSPYKFIGGIGEVVAFDGIVPTDIQRKAIEQSQAASSGVSGSFVPSEPINIVATPGNASASLSWSPPVSNGGSVITDYKIEYKSSSGTGWTTYTDGVSTTTGTTVTGLTNLTKYDFRVSAINTNGTSVSSTVTSTVASFIPGVQLWLRGDSGVITSGSNITNWQDTSGNQYTATGHNTPTLITNATGYNFNTAINFSGVGTSGTPTGSYFSLPSGFDNFTAGLTTYIVARPSSTNSYARFFDFGNGSSSNNIALFRVGTTDSIGYTSYPGTTGVGDITSITGAIVNNQTNIFGARQASLSTSASMIKNGKIITNGTTGIIGNVTRTLNYIGRSNWNDAMYGGTIAEILLYNKDLSTGERSKIESYLALKYGITLDQSIATNYVYSNGSIVWNATTGGIYKNDIAGIGRDDDTTLNQKKSQSVNNSGDIIVEFTGATLLNMRVLTWANNGTATGTWINTENPPGYKRISREWKFQEALGDIGNIKVSYPASSLPTGSTGSIYLFVDIDGNFSTGSSVITGSLVGANYEFGVNIANGGFITFGYKDIVPPTINLSGILSGSLLPIGKGLITLIYNDIDSGISTGSLSLNLQRWNSTGSTYDAPVSTGLTESGSRTTTGSVWNMNNISSGKYRLTASVSDLAGNTTSISVDFYIDGISWSVSSDQYDIGTLTPGVQSFGAGEIIITVQTVGASFSLRLIASNPLVKGPETISYWNGTTGWGYDQWNGTSYPGTIISTGTTGTLATQVASINTNGAKNTYTYRIKYGAKVSAEQAAGIYQGNIRFDLIANY